MKNEAGNYNLEIDGLRYLYQPEINNIGVTQLIINEDLVPETTAETTIAVFEKIGDNEIRSYVNMDNPKFVEMYQTAIKIFKGEIE